MTKIPTHAVLSVVLLPGVLAGCGSGEEKQERKQASPASREVQIQDFKFLPQETGVKAGGTISFTNRDRAPHTAETTAFDTGRLDRGQSKQIKLERPGTYEYFCDFHPFMTGTVEVTE